MPTPLKRGGGNLLSPELDLAIPRAPNPELQPRQERCQKDNLPEGSGQCHCGVRVALPVHNGEALALKDAETKKTMIRERTWRSQETKPALPQPEVLWPGKFWQECGLAIAKRRGINCRASVVFTRQCLLGY